VTVVTDAGSTALLLDLVLDDELDRDGGSVTFDGWTTLCITGGKANLFGLR
jgi:hypothetical protein